MMLDGQAGVIPGTTGQMDDGLPGGAGSSGLALGIGSGRMGTKLLEGPMSNNPFTIAWQWLHRPLNTPMAPTDIFIAVGAVLIAILLWNLILYHIRVAAEAI